MEKVSVVKCENYNIDEVELAIKRSLDIIDFKFKDGIKVLLKPNLTGAFPPDKHATTNPAIVEAVCKILKNKRDKIYIGDSSGERRTRHSFEISGLKKVAENAIKDAAIKYNIEIIELKVMPDHIHCFVQIPPTLSRSLTLQILKGSSSRMIFKECTRWKRFFSLDGKRKPHLWSPGKFFRSVGSVTAEVIEEYIKYSQEEWNFKFINKRQKTLNTY